MPKFQHQLHICPEDAESSLFIERHLPVDIIAAILEAWMGSFSSATAHVTSSGKMAVQRRLPYDQALVQTACQIVSDC